jgi:hypothetical protein
MLQMASHLPKLRSHAAEAVPLTRILGVYPTVEPAARISNRKIFSDQHAKENVRPSRGESLNDGSFAFQRQTLT